MIEHVCTPYCDGQRYMLEEGAHVTDCFIRDDANFPVEDILRAHKLLLELYGCEVIRYWPEVDHKPVGPMRNWFTGELESNQTTYTKHPPYLFLVRRKTQ